VGLLFAAAVSAPTAAHAQQPANAADYPACAKTTENNDEAKRKFIAARQDYEEGNYDSALKRFRDAYALDCKPELLLLIAATWERKGDRQQALTALELYVQRAPKDAPDMSTTQQKIENLKRLIATQPPPPPPPMTPPPAQVEQHEHTIYPWLVVGLGAAGIAAGIILLVTVPELPPNCMIDVERCIRRDPLQSNDSFADDQARAGDHKGQPLVGGIVTAAGGLVVAGGLIWHFLEPTGPKERSARRLVPTVAPGFAGLSFTSKF